MAKEDIVSGVFGITPELYQAGQTQRDIAEQQAARENIGAGLFANAYAPQIQQQAQLTGRAIGGLLGIEDPQMQMVREVSQIRNQFDITTPEGMQGFAQAIAPKYPQLASQAIDRANVMMETGAKAQTAQQKINQEKLLRDELNKLPENASDEDMLKVFRKFGTPDQQARAIQASLDKKAQLAQKQALVDLKAYDLAKTAKEKVQAATDNADRVVSTVEQALPLVGYNTAGAAGSLNIPGTEGRDLETALLTIKANLGFDRLQQMRDASKTGGALGQVAVKELEALQGTVASLDRGQSPDKLRENLKDIKYYYERWRKAVNGEDPGPAVRDRATKETPQQGQKKVVKFGDL